MNGNDSGSFEANLQQRARELAPKAMELLEKLAEGAPCGSTYRVRSTTILSAIKLVLSIARGENVAGPTLDDWQRLEAVKVTSVEGEEIPEQVVDSKELEGVLWKTVPSIAPVAWYLDTNIDDYEKLTDTEQTRADGIIETLGIILPPEELPFIFLELSRQEKLTAILHCGKAIVRKQRELQAAGEFN